VSSAARGGIFAASSAEGEALFTTGHIKRRRSVKKAIELLEEANMILATISTKTISLDSIRLPVAISNIQKAIAELQTPRWYTPEQWEAETGEPWPDDWPIWAINGEGIMELSTMDEEELRKELGTCAYVCVTEAGPPPEDWRPETGGE
jgi:hypothetical protein